MAADNRLNGKLRGKSRIGEIFITNQNDKIEIIEHFNSHNLTIKFNDDETNIQRNLQYSQIKSLSIKNLMKPSVLDIGFIGNGIYHANKHKIYHNFWSNIITRCYSKDYSDKFPTYDLCFVDERWHNFQIFAEWCEKNYQVGFVLDKDILIKGNKIYGPDTCCFVPIEINNLVLKSEKTRNLYIGVYENGKKFQARLNKFGKSVSIGTFDTPEEAFKNYKLWKEEYIKDVAYLWKNKIPEIVYNSLINYNVEITD